MNAHPHRRLVEEAVDDDDLALDRSQRAERSAQRHPGVRALRPPVVAVDAVAHEQYGKPLWIRLARARSTRNSGQRFHPRQRHRRPATTKDTKDTKDTKKTGLFLGVLSVLGVLRGE